MLSIGMMMMYEDVSMCHVCIIHKSFALEG